MSVSSSVNWSDLANVSSNIEHLTVSGIYCKFEDLQYIFISTPRLKYLDVDLINIIYLHYDEIEKNIIPMSTFRTLILYFEQDSPITMNILREYFNCMPVLKHLEIKAHSKLLDGNAWKMLLETSLPLLTHFILRTTLFRVQKTGLHNFNNRGRGEVSRLIFAAGGQKYEDIRYEDDEWLLHKAKMPLGEMPVLEFDGTKLPQSKAIARFLAKQFQLAGRNNLEQGKVDAVVDTIEDLITKLIPVFDEQDDAKREELSKKFFSEELPKHLQNLDVLLKEFGNGGLFFVGNHLTWADLYFYNFFETILGINENCLDTYPSLKQNREEVEKQPKIAEYLKNRPKTSI
ncbi:unnamed protein product [Rotaria sp. Silwood1]|nr:unnamed protein product [Rotaria sp. Silwood1]